MIDDDSQGDAIERLMCRVGIPGTQRYLTSKDFEAIFSEVKQSHRPVGLHLRGANQQIALEELVIWFLRNDDIFLPTTFPFYATLVVTRVRLALRRQSSDSSLSGNRCKKCYRRISEIISRIPNFLFIVANCRNLPVYICQE